jgi:hypothetical protein
MPQITPTAVGCNLFFSSKHPPIAATLTRSNYIRALAALEKCRGGNPLVPKATIARRLSKLSD